MTLKLYGDYRSGALAVELALAEAGLPYEFVEVDLGSQAQRGDEFTRINPQRKLPALVDARGEVLTESLAILLTLDERYPEAKLLPPRLSVQRAHALRWLAFVATEIYPIVEINDYPERFVTEPETEAESMREIARQIWRTRWLLLEDQIAGDPYLLAEGFCMTDIYIAVVSRWAQQDAWRPQAIPKVERITAAVASRPALAAVWAKHHG